MGEPQRDSGREICVSRKVKQRDLVIALVAYKPSPVDVARIAESLENLTPAVGYAVYVNCFSPGDGIERLFRGADLVLVNACNVGYGRAVNALAKQISCPGPYFAAANVDLYWQPGAIEALLGWLRAHSDVALAVPAICDEAGCSQRLCKHDPTILALASRRFLPEFLKPAWLKRYDSWYTMDEMKYDQIFECEYLSGCFMIFRSDVFSLIGGFDERYFLYLEDADITRSASSYGQCLHLPVAKIVHRWGRGSHVSAKLTIVNLVSAWIYFRKWGLRWW